jgi:predicted peroxiredoxin
VADFTLKKGRIMMRILLVASTDTPQALDRVLGLSSASTDRGHEVTAFFNADSVLLLRPGRGGALRELISRGVRLLACRTSALDHGLTLGGAMVEGAILSSIGELVELLGECDRALFVG